MSAVALPGSVGALALLGVLGVAFGSAFVPVVNIEAYLGAYLVVGDGRDWASMVVLALVAAVGQMAGKTILYFVGRGALHIRLPRGRGLSARNTERVARWRRRIEQRPWLAVPLLLLSALVGLPPYAVVSVLAGVLRINVAVFVLTGLAGRFARFLAVLAGVGLVEDLHLF